MAWPGGNGRILFLGARVGGWIGEAERAGGGPDSFECRQPFRPWWEELHRAGLAPGDPEELGLDPSPPLTPGRASAPRIALVLPPRQRTLARAELARAVRAVGPGGTVIACAGGDEGGRTLARDLEPLAGEVGTGARRHCRVAWATVGPGSAEAGATAAEWVEADAPRQLAALDGAWTRPGIFAWDRIDAGSRLLVETLPDELPGGRCADLGAGWGFLSRALLIRNPGVEQLDLFEADARAAGMARRNLRHDPRATVHWHDVTAGLPGRAYDLIVSNPPFHLGRQADPALGISFIGSAAEGLRPGGVLLLVANRQLPYERVLTERFAKVETLLADGGFKVLRASVGTR